MHTEFQLGKIEFNINPRSRRIKVRILADGLKVTLPPGASQQDGLDFIQSVHKKIKDKQNKLSEGITQSQIVIDEHCNLQTLTFSVHAVATDRKNIYFSLKQSVLTIEYPKGTDCKHRDTQHHFWNGISYFLRKEAKRILPQRTSQLASVHGFSFSEVKIQSSKTRWGSCSQNKSINLSLYMMLLPMHLIDYIILHELCHTREMNHGDNFWKWMDKVTNSKSKALRQELKKYHMPQ